MFRGCEWLKIELQEWYYGLLHTPKHGVKDIIKNPYHNKFSLVEEEKFIVALQFGAGCDFLHAIDENHSSFGSK